MYVDCFYISDGVCLGFGPMAKRSSEKVYDEGAFWKRLLVFILNVYFNTLHLMRQLTLGGFIVD